MRKSTTGCLVLYLALTYNRAVLRQDLRVLNLLLVVKDYIIWD